MNDYAMSTSTELEKSQALYKWFESINEVGQGFIDDTSRMIRRIAQEWNEEGIILSMLDRLDTILDYTMETYKVSNTFSILNMEKYDLLRDGLFVIGAKSNVGKSTFLTALNIDLLRENKDAAFLFYSLDDGENLSSKRIISQLLNKPCFKGSISDSDKKSLSADLLDRIIIKEHFDFTRLDYEVNQVKEKCNVKNVFIGIDYLQIMTNVSGLPLREGLNKIVKDLKEFQKAQKDGCVIFLLSQMNKDGDYRETTEIDNQGDICLKITLADDENKCDGKRKIEVTKNKIGERGNVFYSTINHGYNFSELKFKDSGIPIPEKQNQKEFDKRGLLK